jgi:hypothetical protein
VCSGRAGVRVTGIVIGPEPTAKEKVVFMLANEATKHLKGSKPN